MKGRSIAENVLLAQELFRDIRRKKDYHNVVVKLDMAKAYDSVSRIYLTKVTRNFGFDERIIDMVWRIISNNWYSIIVNGKAYGFFNSTRGLKQGDPLLPTLFIIATEVLSKGLNNLNKDADFKGYSLLKWSINHLSYAYDTILFCSSHRKSMKRMMIVLRTYEYASGQMTNLSKSYLYLHDKIPPAVARRIKDTTGIAQGVFPFTYLGCPVFNGRRKIIYFENLLRRVTKRVMSWQNKLLTFGGRYILIRHVLQSIPLCTLFAMNPPKGVVEQLHKVFTRFLGRGRGIIRN